MDRQRAGRPGLSDALAARAHQWVEESCVDQGVPAKITERRALIEVAALLGVASAGVRRSAAPAGEAARGTRAA